MKQMIRISLAIMALAGACLFTACNTTEGVGRDVERAGEGIQDAAR